MAIIQYHNMTLEELIREAEHQDNELAIELSKKYEEHREAHYYSKDELAEEKEESYHNGWDEGYAEAKYDLEMEDD